MVTIREGQLIRWNDGAWNSLSEVARAITGARWSGPAFFGLKKRIAAGRPVPIAVEGASVARCTPRARTALSGTSTASMQDARRAALTSSAGQARAGRHSPHL